MRAGSEDRGFRPHPSGPGLSGVVHKKPFLGAAGKMRFRVKGANQAPKSNKHKKGEVS